MKSLLEVVFLFPCFSFSLTFNHMNSFADMFALFMM